MSISGNYVVTGGAGFIGSAFVGHLNALGIDDIIVVDNPAAPAKARNLVRRRFRCHLHKNDFIDRVRRGSFTEPVAAVIHMGACSSTTETNREYLRENNTRYTETLADWCLDRDVRFVYASSAATYGDGSAGYSDDERTLDRLRPMNAYGQSKQDFDLEAYRSGKLAQIAGIKFFNVYGPNEYHKGDMASVIFKAFNQIKGAGRVRLFKSYRPDYADGEQVRDFIYVKDCLDVIWWLVERKDVSGLFNLGTGKARTWIDLVSAVFRAMNIEPSIEFIEMPEAIRDRYQYHTEAEMGKLRRAGYGAPFSSLEDGITGYVRDHLMKEDPYF